MPSETNVNAKESEESLVMNASSCHTTNNGVAPTGVPQNTLPNLKDKTIDTYRGTMIEGHNSVVPVQSLDLLLPNNRSGQSYGGQGRGVPTIIPISDISEEEASKYTLEEVLLRNKLASLYRLIDLNGWSHGIFNHISARINDEDEHFLIHPFGLLYSEVTASTLEKIDLDGEVLSHGSTSLGINKAGFILHSAIHQARPDLKCIIHLHTSEAVAVSSMKCGFLPMSQEALIIGKVAYHDYQGILVDEKEREDIKRNLGPTKKVMFLRNHGVVACGSTIEEAYHYIVNVMLACQSQIKALSAGLENIVLVGEDVQKKTYEIGNRGGGGVDTGKQKWRLGEQEFEAVMRQLDRVGYKTGYPYKFSSTSSKLKELTDA